MKHPSRYWIGGLAIALSSIVFLVPFAFIILTAMKNRKDASLREFSWPQSFHLWDNIVEVV